MVGRIYPAELQLNQTKSSDIKAPFLDLDLFMRYGIVSSKIYDKRDDFNCEIVNLPFLDGDVPHPPPHPMAYIFRSLFVLRECVLMLTTFTTGTYF